MAIGIAIRIGIGGGNSRPVYVMLVDENGDALVDNEGRAVVIPLAMAERIAA